MILPVGSISNMVLNISAKLDSLVSFNPIATKISHSLATAQSRSVVGLGTVTLLFTRLLKYFWPSLTVWSQVQCGYPAMYVSGNTTRRAPFRAASRINAHALSVVRSRSRNTDAAWTAAAL